MTTFDRATLIARLLRPADDEAALAAMVPRTPDGTSIRAVVAPPGGSPRQGAVLILLYPVGDDWHLPLTVRTAALRQHSGEVSLPGGRQDDGRYVADGDRAARGLGGDRGAAGRR